MLLNSCCPFFRQDAAPSFSCRLFVLQDTSFEDCRVRMFACRLLALTDTVHLYYTVMYNILKVHILIARPLFYVVAEMLMFVPVTLNPKNGRREKRTVNRLNPKPEAVNHFS